MGNTTSGGGGSIRFLLWTAIGVVGAIVAACIWFNLPAAQDPVQLKNVGLGALENQKLDEALKAFDRLKTKVPDDPLPARNIAVARVVALGTEDKPVEGQLLPQLAATANAALAESMRQEGETTSHHWLALHVAFLTQDRAEADAHITALLQGNRDDAAAWYAAYRAYRIGFPEQPDLQALPAIEEACRCSPENAWLRVEWLRAVTELLLRRPDAEFDVPRMREQLAATARAIEPLAHVIQVAHGQDVSSLLATADEALAKGDIDDAFGPLFGLSNVLAPHANPDLRTAMRHPLEFVLDDFNAQYYQTAAAPKIEAFTAIPVQFKKTPITLTGPTNDAAMMPLDFELVDFNVDGWLDIVVLRPNEVVVWSRSSLSDEWQPIASAEVSGYSRLLAHDFDADFDETSAAAFPDFNPAKSQAMPKRENVCPTADADLFLYGSAGALALENRYDVRTRKRSLAPIGRDKLPGGLKNVIAATAIDLEADGDLDLLLADETRMHLWSFVAGWKFVEISKRSKLPENLAVRQLLPIDWDRDVDIDVLVASPDGAGYLENLRHGQFRWRPFEGDFAPLTSAQGIDVADVDGNASWDLLGATTDGLVLATTRLVESGVVRRESTATIADREADGVLAWDYDNDGYEDLVTWSASGLQVWRGTEGRFEAIELPDAAKVPLRKVLTGDHDNDGDIDITTLGQEGVAIWENQGGNSNQWLKVALQALQDRNDQKVPSGRVAPWGTGSLLELKAGRRYQSKLVRGQSTHFGLGKAAQADVVRVVWVNGVPQNILQPKANLFLCEQQTLNTSCPYLYTWDGEKFVFATDLLWNSPLGLQIAEGVLAQPRAWEYLKVPGEQLAVKDGHYILQLTEELWEAAYFDQVRLIAIDHPADAAIYSNEKVGPAAISQYQVHTVRNPRPLQSAKNHQGRELTSEVAAADGNYARVHEKKHRQGVTEESFLELDLGDVAGAKQVTLFLTGWIYPSSTSINVALSQGGNIPPPKPPALLVPDGQGDWKEALPFMGFPGGKTKTIAVDLTGLLAENDSRVRIATTMEFYWDHIFFSADESPVEVRTTDLALVDADLHDRGYSRVVPGAYHGPEQYLYREVSTTPKWPTMPGSFTPLGDVAPLIKEADDRLLVIGAGDEVTMRFKAPEAPLPKGWKRDFFFYSQGWEKDCNLLTVLGESADTLPFRGMRNYPWPADQQAPRRTDPLTRRQSPAFWKAIQRW